MVRAKCSNLLVIALIVIVRCSLSSTELAFADGPPVQWQKTFGGSVRDYGLSVQQTSDGGYIIAGSTYSFGSGKSDVYLIKTDPNGSSQWQKTFGGSKSDYGYSVQQTSDGGYIIAGYTYSFGAGNADVYLIKTEPNGSSQWQKTFEGSGCEYAYSVQQTLDGGYIIAGYTYSCGTGDPNDPIYPYDPNIYLIKTEPNGESQWQKTFGGSESDSAYSVQQTSDGGYIITGYTYSLGAVYADVFLIKTEPNGSSQWQKTFSGDRWARGYSVQQTSDGGYVIAGNNRRFLGEGLDDVYLIKTDPNGDSKWQKTFGGSEGDSAYSVQQTTDGGYIIAGTTRTFGSGPQQDVYFVDVYLIKTEPNGSSQWQKTFGGSWHDCAYSVQQTTDGGYIIAGFTYSFGAGDDDVYLIKLCSEGTLSGDLNCDGTVNYKDVEILVSQWLQPRSILYHADIYGVGDGIVNFNDYAVMAAQWPNTEPCIPDDMAYIPDGEFEMGDHFDEGEERELPVHAVYLDSFFMSKFEITNQQYCDYLNSAYDACDIKVDNSIVYATSDDSNSFPYCDTHSHSAFSQIDYNYVSETFSVRFKGGRDMSDDPMVNVSWYGAAVYCNWRSQQEGYRALYDLSDPNWPCDFSKNGYRLATEAEWEYAARGGEHSPYYRFPWGDTISHSQANYVAEPSLLPYDVSPPEGGYHPTWNDGIAPYTSPAGSFSANGYGLYDMAGNVREWCNDWFDWNYYDTSPYDNPEGPASETYRVLRDGGWLNRADICRVAFRDDGSFGTPGYRFGYLGFRIVLDLN